MTAILVLAEYTGRILNTVRHENHYGPEGSLGECAQSTRSGAGILPASRCQSVSSFGDRHRNVGISRRPCTPASFIDVVGNCDPKRDCSAVRDQPLLTLQRRISQSQGW